MNDLCRRFAALALVVLAGLGPALLAGAETPSCVPIEPIAPVCELDQDCVPCEFPTAPSSPADCYCWACDTAPLSVAVCETNGAEWLRHCGDSAVWPGAASCPDYDCAMPPPAYCDPRGTCRTMPPDYRCEQDADCVVCPFVAAPQSQGDCFCITCDYAATTVARCRARREAWDEHCSDPAVWPAGADCELMLCEEAPDPRCGWDGRCVAQEW